MDKCNVSAQLSPLDNQFPNPRGFWAVADINSNLQYECNQDILAQYHGPCKTGDVVDVPCICSDADFKLHLSCCVLVKCNSNDSLGLTCPINIADTASCSSISSPTATSPISEINSTATLEATQQQLPGEVGVPSSILLPTMSTSSSKDALVSISGASTTTTSTASPASPMETSGTSTSTLSQITLTSSVDFITDYIPVVSSVADFSGTALLTGSCTSPVMAVATDSTGKTSQYPWVGCSEGDGGCCPFMAYAEQYLTVCPQDYTTTSGVCCPTGWSLYSTTMGEETPCYTSASFPFAAASTPTSTGALVITDRIFTRGYVLYEEPQRSPKTNPGTLAGAVVGSVAGFAILAGLVIILLRRRIRHKNVEEAIRKSSEPRAVTKPPPKTEIHELQDSGARQLFLQRDNQSWLTGTSKTTIYSPYQTTSTLQQYNSRTSNQRLSELPGSTFIHEYHPAFRQNSETPAESTESYGSHTV